MTGGVLDLVLEKKLPGVSQDVRDTIQITMGGLASMGIYHLAMNRPDILLGPIPLYHVQYFEIALSQDDLKFRAVGDTYLGDQEGRNSGIRIDCKLIGPTQDIILTAVESLYMHCKGESDIEKDIKLTKIVNDFEKYKLTAANVAVGGGITSTVAGTATTVSKGVGALIKNRNISSFNFDTWRNQSNTPQTTTNYTDLQKDYTNSELNPLKESGTTWNRRQTFILMSSSDILYDMFLQTYIYSRSVEDGRNVINLSLFLRRYDPDRVLHVEFLEDRTTEGEIRWDNYIEYEDFLQYTALKYDPTTPAHRKKLTSLFNKNKRDFIKLETFNVGSNSIKPFGEEELTVNLYNKARVKTKLNKINKIRKPTKKFNKQMIEFGMKSLNRLTTFIIRRMVDNKFGYLNDRKLLDTGILDSLIKITDNVGIDSLINKTVPWTDYRYSGAN